MPPRHGKSELTCRTLRGCVDWNCLAPQKGHIKSSHPSRVCGLKFSAYGKVDGLTQVAPFAGVWIEISKIDACLAKTSMSHPSRVCGLKLHYNLCMHKLKSHPSRGCGLKSWSGCRSQASLYVAPFAGVWIEILVETEMLGKSMSHPSRVCGLKYFHSLRTAPVSCRTLRGCVDWN